jgi:hypothetical protein
LFALLAAAFFLFSALTFLAPGAGNVELETDATGRVIASEVAGDPAAVAVTGAARMLAAGLAILSLALVDWSALVQATRAPSGVASTPWSADGRGQETPEP